MAEMIPDRLPSGASAGERKVFALLQQLPDENNCRIVKFTFRAPLWSRCWSGERMSLSKQLGQIICAFATASASSSSQKTVYGMDRAIAGIGGGLR
jgi:hypothetical protein